MATRLLNDEEKPLIVIHRTPAFTHIFSHRLALTFSLLDPVSVAGNNPSAAAIAGLLHTHAAGARALLCVAISPLGKETLDCLPSLELIVASTTGTDHIDLSECRRRGISVTNIGDAFSDDVADCAVGMLVDVLRRMSASDRFVRAGSWPEQGQFALGSKVGGKRVGIVGLGSIGSRIANRLTAFGCIVSYTSRHKKPNIPLPYYNNTYDLAIQSDILVVCCSLTNETHHVINKDVLVALGNKGVVINVGRGALIDEKELVRFLLEGEIGGVGLDVFEDEPNVPKELFGLDNVVLSPHRAIFTPESFQGAEDAVAANLEAFFSNKPLINPIRWD